MYVVSLNAADTQDLEKRKSVEIAAALGLQKEEVSQQQKNILIVPPGASARKDGSEFTIEADDDLRFAEYNEDEDSYLVLTDKEVLQKAPRTEGKFKTVYTSDDSYIVSAHHTNDFNKLLIAVKKEVLTHDMETGEQKLVFQPHDNIQSLTYDKEKNKLVMIIGSGYFPRTSAFVGDVSTGELKYIYKDSNWNISSRIRHNKDWSKLLMVMGGNPFVYDLQSHTFKQVCLGEESRFTRAIAVDEDMSTLLIQSRGGPQGSVIIYDQLTGQKSYVQTPDAGYTEPMQANESGSKALLACWDRVMECDIETKTNRPVCCLPLDRGIFRYIVAAHYTKNGSGVQVVSKSCRTHRKLHFTSFLLNELNEKTGSSSQSNGVESFDHQRGTLCLKKVVQNLGCLAFEYLSCHPLL